MIHRNQQCRREALAVQQEFAIRRIECSPTGGEIFAPCKLDGSVDLALQNEIDQLAGRGGMRLSGILIFKRE